MSNPFEFRELMKAQMRFNEERTVEQVVAEQKARHQQRQPPAKRGKKGAATPPPHGVIAQSELDKMRALLNKSRPTE